MCEGHKDMGTRYYFAPLEGITGFVYRNVYDKYFGGIDKYFTPFIATNQHFALKGREQKDVLPENNEGIPLVPQILTNNAEQFLDMAEKLAAFGYREVNLNLGCPSRTVVTKKKGAGFLAYPEELDEFLYEIFHRSPVEISIKTRLGMENEEEFVRLLHIYHKYPLKELIVHPRLQTDYYKNHPRMESYRYAQQRAEVPLCYNGDLFTAEAIRAFREHDPQTERIMLGRGLLMTPSLLRELAGEARDLRRWYDFLSELCEAYRAELSGEQNVLFKMKEHWNYLLKSLPEGTKYAKEIRKCRTLAAYEASVRAILL